jgi:hypothetical protein
MVSLATAFVDIRPNTAGFGARLSTSVSADADRAGRTAGSRFAGAMKNAMKLGSVLAGAAAVTGGISFFKGAIEEARDAQKVGAQTAAVLKSTGGAAGISAKGIGDLATAISNKTAVDDEAIQSGANLLLTFTNVRNEVGKGNDIFNQATKTAVDMSAALGQDMKSSSIQLGKALNDPIKGVTALSRVGVSFTQQQKDQIATMVQTGDTMGAQKLVLAELNKEFAGSAEAQATPAERAQVAWGNFQESIGTAVLPMLDKLLTWFTDEGLPGVQRFGNWFQHNILPTLKDFGGFIQGTVVPALAAMGRWIGRNTDWLVPLAAGIGTAVAVIKTISAVTKAWAAAQVLLNVVLTANPIGLVIAAIAALVVGLVVAYKKSETFRNIVNGAFDAVKGASQALWDRIKAFFGWLGDGFRKMGQLAGDFRQAIGNAWDAVKRGTQTAVLFVVDKVLWLADKMLGAMAKAFSWVPGLGPKLRKASDAVGAFRAAVNAEMDKINDEEVKVTVRGITETIKGASRSTGEFASIGKARGGPIPMLPGAVPGKDSVHVLAMPGEHYLTADEVKKAGGHHGVEAIRAGIRAGIFRKSGDIGWDPGRRSREGVQALANGGPVFDVNTHLPPTGAIVAAREHMTDQLAAEMTKRLKAAAAAALRKAAMGGSPLPGGGKLTPAQIARGQAFARREAGKPYIWGGVGPTGYDCSGFVSAVLNAALGVGPYFRRGSTGTMPWPGSSPGTGSFTYGFFKGSPGHTAGNIGGLAFESTNGSTRVGGAARSATSFPSVYHYDRGGMARGAGFLPKGTTRPERVLSPRQTESFERLVEKLERGGLGGPAVVMENVYTRDETELARRVRREQEKALALAVMP